MTPPGMEEVLHDVEELRSMLDRLRDKFAKRFHEREDYIVQLERQLDLLKHERDELADENARLKQKVGSSGDDRPPEIRLA
ncbi:hypothetical protein AAVH_12134 [Aphelenchoides avenae]|nr:hypothetical protein AAVH_12134 [Aphelenchus avenae]